MGRVEALLGRSAPVDHGGDRGALSAVFGRRRGLAWCLVRRATSSDLEDPDAVLLEGIRRAVVRQFPTEEAFYASIHSHLLSTIRKARRRQVDLVSLEVVAGMMADAGGWDPVAAAAVEAVAARQVNAAVPAELVRAAADRLSGRVGRVSAADRQRLHRWRARNAELVAAAA